MAPDRNRVRQKKVFPLVEKVEVVDVGTKGKNIAKSGSQVILVDNAVPGDIVDIQISRKKKGLAEGTAVHFHKYSPFRVQPVCRHFEHCGGCSWQNIRYDPQLAFKEKMVSDAFKRIGKLDFPSINPIIGSEKTEYYRNRLDFAFSAKKWLTLEE